MGVDGDAVLPIKWESPMSGGTELDTVPTEIDPWEDRIASRGLWLQRPSPDSTIRKEAGCSQDGAGRMTFADIENETPVTLSDLVAGAGGLTPDSHKILRQLIHFIDDGPAEGFDSGAYREITTPGIFPDVITWYTDSGKTHKIVDVSLTWLSAKVTQEQWRVYAVDGSTVLATVTDAISYSGAFEDSRTRTIVT